MQITKTYTKCKCWDCKYRVQHKLNKVEQTPAYLTTFGPLGMRIGPLVTYCDPQDLALPKNTTKGK